ncbi:hypothetical protein A2U01_0099307, partial [Trifolium medium]|nr:hypothetical protein [Trifolium medium]
GGSGRGSGVSMKTGTCSDFRSGGSEGGGGIVEKQ